MHNGRPMAIIVGYARVSTGSQSYVDQVAQLERAGAVRIFHEKESGARSDRPQLAKAIASLDEGDVLLVTRLDRLARSTRDLLNIVHAIGEPGAAFKSLADSWADTSNAHFHRGLLPAGHQSLGTQLDVTNGHRRHSSFRLRRAVRRRGLSPRYPGVACFTLGVCAHAIEGRQDYVPYRVSGVLGN